MVSKKVRIRLQSKKTPSSKRANSEEWGELAYIVLTKNGAQRSVPERETFYEAVNVNKQKLCKNNT